MPPLIHELSQAACLALLARRDVGRLAFSFNDRVDIQPVHYVYDAHWIYGRTSEGAKLVTLAHNRWVAFETDEVSGPFDWASVVVHGTFQRLDGHVTRAEAAVAAHAETLLRRIVPATLTSADPVPHRMVLFRVSVGEISGRSATSSDARTHDARTHE
jgi:nitroimidazol reductase NimA-like FMN-containing flavoprotein (pyridoxamine 5'-phosphate oxidase superfamily)